MNSITKAASSGSSPFDSIRHYRADGSEFWLGRELMTILGYKTWEFFAKTITRASIACKNAGNDNTEHFRAITKKSKGRDFQEYELSRYSCYLIAMNGDPEKDEIAQAQSYFAVKAREAEVTQSISFQPEFQSLPPQRDAIDYANAATQVSALPEGRLKRLLDARLVSELSLDRVNQSQALLPAEQPKQYTTATVRAAQLGYGAQQIGGGTGLGTFVGKAVKREFRDWQGQYLVWHYEVNDELDARIHAYFS
jgi:hypothetical protein